MQKIIDRKWYDSKSKLSKQNAFHYDMLAD